MSVRVLRVEGDARSRGERIGAAFAEPIRRSLAFYRGFISRRGLEPDGLPGVLGPYREVALASLPDLVEEIDGMARGAGVSPWELFAVNAFEELEPLLLATGARPEHCTAFVVAGEDGPILAHNEQWLAGDAGNVAVIVARPDDGPAFASPTVMTCVPAVGMNAAGGAQAIMSLWADDDGVGIPRVLVSRNALQAASPDDGVARATPPGRAGGYAHLFAFADGASVVVETSATGSAVVPGPAHTNHYVDAALSASAPEPTASSTDRLDRTNDLLAGGVPSTVESVMAVLRDHGPGADMLCAHPRAEDGDEADAIVFSMVCDVGQGRMWVAPGNPCVTPFEEIDLRGVRS